MECSRPWCVVHASVALGLTFALVACSGARPGSTDAGPVDAGLPELPPPSQDAARDVRSTALTLDLGALRGTARIEVAGSPRPGLSLEVGDLVIESVTAEGRALRYAVVPTAPDAGLRSKQRLDVGVPPGAAPATIEVTYTFQAKTGFDGWSPTRGVTFLWPYLCSNLFPCRSNPDDGATFTMQVRGAPAGQVLVYPESIPAPAPAYMPAVAVGAYRYVRLGATDAGTEVGYYVLPAEEDGGVVEATSRMVDVVAWLERTLGPYAFGPKLASVDVHWGDGSYGGMEHHPYFHVSAEAFGDENVHAHEAAHGWYGDGVRLRCWEDFVLSEGTVDYLAIRAVEQVRGAAEGRRLWAQERELLDEAVRDGDTVAWPQGCGQVDLLNDPLWSNIPYTKGAFFYRRVADQVGAEALDRILGLFYRQHRGQAAGMADMLALIRAETGFDPTPLANTYLRSLGNPEE
jgi:aminopeptidase N